MTSSQWLRIAALVALLQFVGHGWLFVSAVPRHGAEEVAVIEAMKSHHFNFLGSMRSYWDFYFGYGVEAAFVCLIESVLFWRLASMARTGRDTVRPIVALFLAANLGHMLLVGRYFFLTPLVIDAMVALCLGLAWIAPERRGGIPPLSGRAMVRDTSAWKWAFADRRTDSHT
jgi:hypothetical protein